MRLHALLMALVEHLGSYMELGAAAATEMRGVWLRRALLLVLAAVAFLFGISALWLAGLMAVWSSGWAVAYVTGSGALLLLGAVAACVAALRRPATGPASGLLRSELNKDVELFQEWTSTNLR